MSAENEMSQSDLIALFKEQGRVPRQRCSLHDHEDTSKRCEHRHGWRTIVCNDIEDITECPDCGAQRLEACNFDEDFA